uniref:Chitin-binding type-2 domain-containing protein n=1 Tax=Anopheles christyi TaxID=43041 RepID=A0A182K9J4_9DIPT
MFRNVLILLLPVLAVSAVTVDPRCTRYSAGSEAQVLPYLQDCRKFVICDLRGNGQVLSCPPGLYFSDEAHACSFDMASCTHGELELESVPSAPIIPQVQPVLPPQPSLPVAPLEPLPLPEPQPLPMIPSVPVVPIVPPVGEGSNAVESKPSIPNWLPIVTAPPVVEAPVEEQAEIEQHSPQSVCWDQPMGKIYPIAMDCGLYVVCMGDNNAIVERCPKGLLYDRKQQRCEFAEASFCATPRVDGHLVLDVHGVDMSLLNEVEEDVFAAEPYSVPVVPVNDHAPAKISEMIHREHQPILFVPEPVIQPALPIVEYNFRIINNHPRCLARSNMDLTVQLPHDTDCSKYLVCVGRVAIEKLCPAGQHWNTNYNWCDFPSLAGCAL